MRKVINVRFENTFTGCFQFARNFNEIPPKASTFFSYLVFPNSYRLVERLNSTPVERSWNRRNNNELVDNQSHVELISIPLNSSLRLSGFSNRSNNSRKRYFSIFKSTFCWHYDEESENGARDDSLHVCGALVGHILCAAHAFKAHMATFGILIIRWGWRVYVRLSEGSSRAIWGLLNGVQEISYPTTFKQHSDICISRGRQSQSSASFSSARCAAK